MAALVLLRLHAWTGDGRYRTAAERAIRTVVPFVGALPDRVCPMARRRWTSALRPIVEIAIVGPPDDAGDAGHSWPRRDVGYRPGQVLAVGADPAASAIPLLDDRIAIDGRPTAYVCRGFVCRLPVTTVEALRPSSGPSSRLATAARRTDVTGHRRPGRTEARRDRRPPPTRSRGSRGAPDATPGVDGVCPGHARVPRRPGRRRRCRRLAGSAVGRGPGRGSRRPSAATSSRALRWRPTSRPSASCSRRPACCSPTIGWRSRAVPERSGRHDRRSSVARSRSGARGRARPAAPDRSARGRCRDGSRRRRSRGASTPGSSRPSCRRGNACLVRGRRGRRARLADAGSRPARDGRRRDRHVAAHERHAPAARACAVDRRHPRAPGARSARSHRRRHDRRRRCCGSSCRLAAASPASPSAPISSGGDASCSSILATRPDPRSTGCLRSWRSAVARLRRSPSPMPTPITPAGRRRWPRSPVRRCLAGRVPGGSCRMRFVSLPMAWSSISGTCHSAWSIRPGRARITLRSLSAT